MLTDGIIYMMRKPGSGIKKFILILCIITVWTCSFAGAFSWDRPTLNEEGYAAYKSCDTDALSEAVNSGDKDYSGKYLGTDVVIAGEIVSVGSGSAVVRTGKGTSVTVNCDKAILSKYSEKNKIKAYGVISANKKNALVLKAKYIVGTTATQIPEGYYIHGPGTPEIDRSYTTSKSVHKTISDGRVSYDIPNTWTACEAGLEDKNKIFNLNDVSDANCYYLNSLTGNNVTECFVIFDLDYKEYLYGSDWGYTQVIEKTIVSNICRYNKALSLDSFIRKAMLNFTVEKPKNNIGLDADYYVGAYNNEYSVEFVFVPESDHMCVMMYIHKSDISARDDVLYVVRTVEFK